MILENFFRFFSTLNTQKYFLQEETLEIFRSRFRNCEKTILQLCILLCFLTLLKSFCKFSGPKEAEDAAAAS